MAESHNRLTSVIEKSNGTTVNFQATYTYDVAGNLIREDTWSSTAGSATVKHTYDGSTLIADLNSSLVVQTRYFYDPNGSLVAELAGSTVNWAGTDHLGSLRDMFGSTGAVTAHVEYTAFGVITSDTAPAVAGNVLFQGMYQQAVTLNDVTQHRIYDPITGRWLTVDPEGFGAGDDNLYRFVGNDATNATDGFGTDASRVDGQDEKEFTDSVKDPIVKFANGAEGVVKVFRDITIRDANSKKDPNWIQLEFKITKGADKIDMSKLHWIQIVRSGGLVGDGRTFSIKDPVEGEVWKQHGAKFPSVDGRLGAYDLTGERQRNAMELSIFDKPDAEEDKINGEFDSFLVYDGKPIYYIHWEASFGFGDNPTTYSRIRGTPITDKISDVIKSDRVLLNFLKDDELLWAFGKRKGKYEVDKTTIKKAKNFIDAKYR